MEILLSAHSASKKKKKLLKIKTKAINRISEEEADDNHKKTYNLNDDEDHFEYNLKKFKLNK